MRNPMPYSLSASTDILPDMFHAFLRPIRQGAEDGAVGMGMGVDLTESDAEFVLKAEIPGVSKEDISVEVDDNIVTIRANKEQNKEDKDEDVQAIAAERRSNVRRENMIPRDIL